MHNFINLSHFMKKNIDSKQEKIQALSNHQKQGKSQKKEPKSILNTNNQDKGRRPNINISFNIISNNFINKQDALKKQAQLKSLSKTLASKIPEKQQKTLQQTKKSGRIKKFNELQKYQLQKVQNAQITSLTHRKIRSSIQCHKQAEGKIVKKHKRTPCSMDLPILQKEPKYRKVKKIAAIKKQSQGKSGKNQKKNNYLKPYQTDSNINSQHQIKVNQFFTQGIKNERFNNQEKVKKKSAVSNSKAKPRPNLQKCMQDYRSGRISSGQFKKKLLKYVQSENSLVKNSNSLKQVQASSAKNQQGFQNDFINSDSSKQIKLINVGQKSIIQTFIQLKDLETQLVSSQRSFSILTNRILSQQQKFQENEQRYQPFDSNQKQQNKIVADSLLNRNLNHIKSLKLHTSNSVKQMRKNLQRQRKTLNMIFPVKQTSKIFDQLSYQNQMALKIQKAWRQCKTRKLIKKALNFNKKIQTVTKFSKVGSKNKNAIIYYDSQQDDNKNCSQEISGLQERTLQKSKRLNIMSMIKDCLSNGSEMSKEVCLKNIIKQIGNAESQFEIDQLHSENLSKFKQMKEPVITKNRQFQLNENDQHYYDQRRPIKQQNIKIQPVSLLQVSEATKIKDKKSEKSMLQQVQNQFQKLLYGQIQLDSYSKLQKIDKKSDINKNEAIDSKIAELKFLDFTVFIQKLARHKQLLKENFQRQVQELSIQGKSNNRQMLESVKAKYQSQIRQIDRIRGKLTNNYRQIKKIVNNQIKTKTIQYLNQGYSSALQEEQKLDGLKRSYSQKYLAKKFTLGYRSIFLDSPSKKVSKQHLKVQQQQDSYSQSGQEIPFQNFTGYQTLKQFRLKQEQTSSIIENSGNLNFEEFSHQYSDEQQHSLQNSDSKFKRKFQNLKHQIQLDQAQEYSDIPRASQIKFFNSDKKNQSIKEGLQRYISRQEKENIFEFLFLDLCLEMFLDLPKNSKIVSTINQHIKDLNDAAKAQSLPKGVKTNLHAVRQYLQKLFNFILSNYKNQLNHLESPIGPTALQMLRYMHDYQQDENMLDVDQENITLVLSTQVFQAFQKVYAEQVCEIPRFFQNKKKEQSRRAFLKSVIYVHHKAIFDSLNQFLDYERSYGIWGTPFPWKCQVFQRKFSFEQQKTKLRCSMDRILKIGAYLTGILVDKEDSILKNHFINEDYLKQIREDRLAKMLSNDLLENQDRWTFYDDQEAQILIEVSSFVFRQIIKEVSRQIMAILQ